MQCGVKHATLANICNSHDCQVRAALVLWLTDDDVGAILGRKGQTLVDIQQSARVAIKISDRAKMDPTTNEREVRAVLI